MKLLHRPDLYGWSAFNPERNIDFNGIVWIRPSGNILIDPMPLFPYDWEHLQSLGGVAWIAITNSDHIRASQEIAQRSSPQLAGPLAEKETFPIHCDRWLADGDILVPGLQAIALHGSKTPGELAFLLEKTTLITGDLVRAHQAGSLTILPEGKLQNRDEAVASVRRLAALEQVEAVLVGDGWPIFRNGGDRLLELANTL